MEMACTESKDAAVRAHQQVPAAALGRNHPHDVGNMQAEPRN